MATLFSKAAEFVARLVGTAWAFILAAAVIAGWAVLGPIFGFSDTWQLVINTATTIVTFLMVFLIQNTQNRDNTALHAKLDDLILTTAKADNNLIASEHLSDDDVERLRSKIERRAKRQNTRANGTNNGKRPGRKRTARRSRTSP